MLQQLFGTELAFPIRVAVALGVVAALLGATVLVMRRLAERSRANTPRGRGGPRLAVVESVPLDQRRKLVLVRRDEVEHLLVIGGGSDLVVEPQIGAAPEPAAGALPPGSFTPASLPPAREAPSLPRTPPRQRLGTAGGASPLAVAAVAPLPDAPAVADTPEAAPAEPAPRETRRAPIGRKPLLRGDGTMSVARPASPATIEHSEPETAPAPTAPRLEARSASRTEAEPRPEQTAAAEAEAADEAGERLEAMVQRLDAALREPAPQLSLSDLLEDAPGTPSPGPAERPQPRVIQRPRQEPRVAFEPSRGRPDPLPRFERPAAPGPAPEVAPMRLREFAFRPSETGEPRDEPRREPVIKAMDTGTPAPFSPAAAAPAAISPAVSAPALILPAAPEVRPASARGEDAPAVIVPPVSPKAADDPLDDFDAEMADLLGRSTARGR